MYLLKKARKVQIPKIFFFGARLFLGGIFIYASIDKIAFPATFAEIINNYGILPVSLAKFVAFALPWVELILGISLVIGFMTRESALILTFLLIIFLFSSGIQATKGPIKDCGCFPSSSILSSNNLLFLVLRDASLLSVGLFIIFQNKTNKGHSNG